MNLFEESSMLNVVEPMYEGDSDLGGREGNGDKTMVSYLGFSEMRLLSMIVV
jgi:hypothetical protein